MGPSTYTRIAEITSGRSHFQQGLTATCEDREEELMQSRRGGFGIGTWARMSCEEGVTPFEVILEVTPREVTPQRGKGALGAWWAKRMSAGRDIDPTNAWLPSDAESWIKPAAQGVYASQRLSFGAAGKGLRGTVTKVANRTREIRPSGMKTGASGNVTMGAGLRAATKVAESPPDPTVRAPEFYPHISQSGSGGGPGWVTACRTSSSVPD